MADDFKSKADSFSHHDDVLMQNPHPFYEEARSKCPVAHSEALGGFYYATRFDAVRQIYSDFRDFSSAEGSGLPAQPVKMYPIDLDPPEQTKYRKILNPTFTPENVATHRARIEEIIDHLFDGIAAKGEAELLGEVIRPALATIVLPILGVPMADHPIVSEKLDYLVRHRTTDPEGCMRLGGEMCTYLMGLAAQRRKAPRKDDVLQTLIDSEIDGVPVSDDQVFRVLTVILFGGLDTTSAALGEALLHLARNPEDAERLRKGEVSWETAIEEFVRFTSPIQGLRRTVTRDVVLDGQTLHARDLVLALNAAANRDPEKFAEPNRCIIDRENNDHIGFGTGAHVCLGRNVARLVMEVFLKAMLSRFPDYQVPDDFVPEYAVGEARGMKTLPIRFAVRQRAVA